MQAYQPATNVHPVWLRDGSTVSEAANVGRETVIGFSFPVGFESSAVTFLTAAGAEEEYVPLFDPVTNTAISVASTAGRAYQIAATELTMLRDFKIVAGTIASEDRQILVFTRATA